MRVGHRVDVMITMDDELVSNGTIFHPSCRMSCKRHRADAQEWKPAHCLCYGNREAGAQTPWAAWTLHLILKTLQPPGVTIVDEELVPAGRWVGTTPNLPSP